MEGVGGVKDARRAGGALEGILSVRPGPELIFAMRTSQVATEVPVYHQAETQSSKNSFGHCNIPYRYPKTDGSTHRATMRLPRTDETVVFNQVFSGGAAVACPGNRL
jgi:hypothetical protein